MKFTPHSIAAVTLSALFVSSPLFSSSINQDKPTEDTDLTQLELLATQKGSAFIKSYEKIGHVKMLYSAEVTVKAITMEQPAVGVIEHGATVVVKESGRIERESSSFIDYEEIDALIAGIDYITGVTDTPFSMYEASFQTNGGVTLTVFNDDSGAIKAVIESGRIGSTSAYATPTHIKKFKGLLIKAKEANDRVR